MMPRKYNAIVTSLALFGLTGLFQTASSMAVVPRRQCVATLASTATAVLTGSAAPADAAVPTKGRTDGYAVRHTEREWAYLLSGAQYNILRQGGTERQKSSILNTFTALNVGTYVCAGCDSPLFASGDKFSSGTGWPSFASSISDGVEAEDMDPVRAALGGREVRCRTCGGHLGDLFGDGWLYKGTPAARTGQRFCIDGAALIFRGDDGKEVFGDTPPPGREIRYEPSLYRSVS